MTAVGSMAQNRPVTLAEVDSMLVRGNLWLRHSRLDIDAAEGEYAQAKRYENPELQVMHNARNPVNGVWFDTGHDAETDVQLSLPIAIGGQHRSKVRQAEAMLLATKAAHEATWNDARCTARSAFIDLYSVQQKLKVYSQEITSVEKMLDAYQEQAEKGNVSQMQSFRMAAMLNQLRSERASLLVEENGLQRQLGVWLNQENSDPIEAWLDEDDMVAAASRTLLRLRPLAVSADTALLQSIVRRHPEAVQAEQEEEGARHAVEVERAEALPHVAINGEWDKNGSIGYNFFAVGATVSLPLWNRNQGAVRQAQARYAQAAVAREQKERELRASLLTHYHAAIQQLKLVEEQQQQLSADLDRMLEAADRQFMKHNISVVEFVDLHASYRDTKFQMLDAKAELAKENEELNRLIGENL